MLSVPSLIQYWMVAQFRVSFRHLWMIPLHISMHVYFTDITECFPYRCHWMLTLQTLKHVYFTDIKECLPYRYHWIRYQWMCSLQISMNVPRVPLDATLLMGCVRMYPGSINAPVSLDSCCLLLMAQPVNPSLHWKMGNDLGTCTTSTTPVSVSIGVI